MINGSGTREGEGRMKEKHTGIEIDAKGLAVQIQGSKHQCDDCWQKVAHFIVTYRVKNIAVQIGAVRQVPFLSLIST